MPSFQKHLNFRSSPHIGDSLPPPVHLSLHAVLDVWGRLLVTPTTLCLADLFVRREPCSLQMFFYVRKQLDVWWLEVRAIRWVSQTVLALQFLQYEVGLFIWRLQLFYDNTQKLVQRWWKGIDAGGGYIITWWAPWKEGIPKFNLSITAFDSMTE